MPRWKADVRLKNGEIGQVWRGIYIELPYSADEMRDHPEQIAAAINQTLRTYAMRLVSKVFPQSIFAFASAFRQGADNDNQLFMIGTKANSVVIGDMLASVLPHPIMQRVQPLKVEVRRPRQEQALRPEKDFIELPINDDFLDQPGALEHVPRPEHVKNQLSSMTYRVTVPRRTILDLCRYEEEAPLALSEPEFQALLQLAGLPHHGDNAFSRIQQAMALIRQEYAHIPDTAFEYLANRLHNLSETPDLIPQTQFNRNQAVEEFSLRWFGQPMARIIMRRDNRWVFHYEDGWALPVWREEANKTFPAFLSNLFPEQTLILPHERAEFLKGHSRLLSNLTIVDIANYDKNIEDDKLEIGLDQVSPNPVVFQGEVRGLPAINDEFAGKTRQIMMHGAMTQISGAHLKVPMHLGVGHIRPAIDAPFTHILKFPLSDRMRNIAVLEWFAMTLAKEAGLNLPAFRLVDMNNIDPTTYDPDLYLKADTHQVMDSVMAAIPNTEYVPEEPDVLVRRLSEELVSPQDITELQWSDVIMAAGLVDGSIFGGPKIDTEGGCMPPGFLIERFDIPTQFDNRWRMSEDFCSLTNRVSDNADVKYTGSMEEVAQTLKEQSTNWDADKISLYQLILANILLCNNDGHLKNISILRTANTDGTQFDSVRLAPLYDITCTAGIAANKLQALPLCGTRNPDREILLRFARQSLDLGKPEAEQELDRMARILYHRSEHLSSHLPAFILQDTLITDDVQRASRYIQTACLRYSEQPFIEPEKGETACRM